VFAPKEVKEIKKEKVEGDDDGDAPAEEPAAEEGENTKPKFSPEDFQWTVTNGKPKNLPQLFSSFKANVTNL
jgi:hypothetical protein